MMSAVIGVVAENLANNPGLAMIQRTHRIECVRGVACAGFDAASRATGNSASECPMLTQTFRRAASAITSIAPGISGAIVIMRTCPRAACHSFSKILTVGSTRYSGG